MRSVRSAKKTAIKRLSSSFESEESSSETSSDNFDLSDFTNADEEKPMVFNEEDIVLVDYDMPDSPEPKKNVTKRRKGTKRGQNISNYKRDKVDDSDIVEAIIIDFDTPTRKLEVESKIFLNKIDIFQIPEIFNRRQIWRFQRLEKISQANLKRRSMDEVLMEEEEERRSQSAASTSNSKPAKRVRFE